MHTWGCCSFKGLNFYRKLVVSYAALAILAGCAVQTNPPEGKVPVQSAAQQRQAMAQVAAQPEVKVLKRKIAIGRFTNETRYGRTFIRDASSDPLGKQASDMLAARLVESGKFLVFERPDLARIKKEQEITGESDIIGVDTLILGSVTEFGRATSGATAFLSDSVKQKAHSKVEIRLADPKTGQVFFSAAGQGEATSESSSVMGFGSRQDYDGTLNDKAIGAAVTDLMNALVAKLEERPWRTDILKVQGSQVYISGGSRQGLKVGDTLLVMREGEKVKSKQTGATINLPASQVASLRVVSQFGESDLDEGSICTVTSGNLSANTAGLFVAAGS